MNRSRSVDPDKLKKVIKTLLNMPFSAPMPEMAQGGRQMLSAK
jgi:hypothetical protein